MDVITQKVVRSLWGGQHVDWIYKGVVGASGGMLLMWDRRVVEKREECMGCYTLVLSRMWRIILSRLFGGCMDRILMWRGGFNGRSWLG